MQKFLLNFYMHFSQYFHAYYFGNRKFDNHQFQWILLFSRNTFLYKYIHIILDCINNLILLCRLVNLFLFDRLCIRMQNTGTQNYKTEYNFFKNFIGISYIPLPALAISRLILLEQSTLSFSAMASSSCEKGAGLLKASCQCRKYINIRFHIYSSRNSLSTFTVYYYCYKQKIYMKLSFYFSVLVAARKKK